MALGGFLAISPPLLGTAGPLLIVEFALIISGVMGDNARW